MEIAIFWQKAASWRKIKEKRPHLKFNFTTRTSSIYLSRPFLKLGNGNRLTLVLLLHISTGCPTALGPLCFRFFLGFQSTYRGTFHSHWIAHKLDFEVNIFQKVKMCKSRTKVKQLPFPSFRKGLDRQIDDVLVVKLNFKWGLFS